MLKADQRGILYIIPSPLGADGLYTIPEHVCEMLPTIRHFFVENEKESRRFLVKLFKERGESEALERVSQIEWLPLDQLPRNATARQLFEPIFAGRDMGLLSDAGCPAIADPGAELVRWAHHAGVVVKPLVGPSSILLAIMASGLGGQRFAFQGYLPRDGAERKREIQRLETRSRQERQTQVFIETPYRNEAVFDELIASLSDEALLCVAIDLTLLTEEIHMFSVANWKRNVRPSMNKRPCIFAFTASPH